MSVRDFYIVSKPGIVYGNAFTAVAGYVLGATTGFSVLRFVGTVLGVCLIIASGCAFNNVLDRPLDRAMKRTKNRPTVSGALTARAVIVYGGAVGLSGFGLLALAANPLTMLLGVIALTVYVGLYGYAKRFTRFGVAVGSISGALPPVAGYVAARGRLDVGALILFTLLTVWQMPHFYAIAIYRRAEYKAAGIPVLSVRRGALATQRRIFVYLVIFIAVTPLLTLFRYAGATYLILALVLAVGWLVQALRSYRQPDIDAWARGIFRYSLVIVTAMPVLIALGRFLP